MTRCGATLRLGEAIVRSDGSVLIAGVLALGKEYSVMLISTGHGV